jgi:hypothetical protein
VGEGSGQAETVLEDLGGGQEESEGGDDGRGEVDGQPHDQGEGYETLHGEGAEGVEGVVEEGGGEVRLAGAVRADPAGALEGVDEVVRGGGVNQREQEGVDGLAQKRTSVTGAGASAVAGAVAVTAVVAGAMIVAVIVVVTIVVTATVTANVTVTATVTVRCHAEVSVDLCYAGLQHTLSIARHTTRYHHRSAVHLEHRTDDSSLSP